MKSSDGFDTPTLRECGYAFLVCNAKSAEEAIQILKQIGLDWIDEEEED